jgi:hypothetical protein
MPSASDIARQIQDLQADHSTAAAERTIESTSTMKSEEPVTTRLMRQLQTSINPSHNSVSGKCPNLTLAAERSTIAIDPDPQLDKNPAEIQHVPSRTSSGNAGTMLRRTRGTAQKQLSLF